MEHRLLSSRNVGEIGAVSASGMDWIALAISVAASLALLCLVIFRCRSGFEFTDESYYLNWISDPWLYRPTSTQFGFVYHPLYKLLHDDVALLRQANVLLQCALAVLLCVTLLWSLRQDRIDDSLLDGAGLLGVAIIAAVASLLLFAVWIPTPSYNSLNFQSLMITAIGALLTAPKPSKRSILGWGISAFGVGLSFLAKPTTAAVLACALAAYMIAAGKFRTVGLLVFTVVLIAFIGFAAVAIDGAVINFATRMQAGAASGNRLLAGNQITSIFRGAGVITHLGQIAALLASIPVVGMLFYFFNNRTGRICGAIVSIALLAISGTPLWATLPFETPYRLDVLKHVATYLVAAGGATAIACIILASRQSSPERRALACFLALIPFAYSFGTGANFWQTATLAGLFWLLSIIEMRSGSRGTSVLWLRLLPVVICSLSIASASLVLSMEQPYRQSKSLRSQTILVDINRKGSKLLLSAEVAQYVGDLRRLSDEAGLQLGDYLLDLSEGSPGSSYMLGTRPLGVAWTLAGYEGSNDFLVKALDQVPCEAITASWLLLEPDSKNSFSPDILRNFGINAQTDYVDVGSVVVNSGNAPRIHHLLKPSRQKEDARVACQKLRGSVWRPHSDHFSQYFNHPVDFLVAKMRIDRQGKYLPRLALRHFKLSLAIAEIGHASHGMDWPAIGDAAVDFVLGQSLDHPVTICRMLDNIGTINMPVMSAFSRQG
jgi:hypothetical protein